MSYVKCTGIIWSYRFLHVIELHHVPANYTTAMGRCEDHDRLWHGVFRKWRDYQFFRNRLGYVGNRQRRVICMYDGVTFRTLCPFCHLMKACICQRRPDDILAPSAEELGGCYFVSWDSSSCRLAVTINRRHKRVLRFRKEELNFLRHISVVTSQ